MKGQRRFTVGNTVLPFNPSTYIEVLVQCLFDKKMLLTWFDVAGDCKVLNCIMWPFVACPNGDVPRCRFLWLKPCLKLSLKSTKNEHVYFDKWLTGVSVLSTTPLHHGTCIVDFNHWNHSMLLIMNNLAWCWYMLLKVLLVWTLNSSVAVQAADCSRRTAGAANERCLRCGLSSLSCTVVPCAADIGEPSHTACTAPAHECQASAVRHAADWVCCLVAVGLRSYCGHSVCCHVYTDVDVLTDMPC